MSLEAQQDCKQLEGVNVIIERESFQRHCGVMPGHSQPGFKSCFTSFYLLNCP